MSSTSVNIVTYFKFVNRSFSGVTGDDQAKVSRAHGNGFAPCASPQVTSCPRDARAIPTVLHSFLHITATVLGAVIVKGHLFPSLAFHSLHFWLLLLFLCAIGAIDDFDLASLRLFNERDL